MPIFFCIISSETSLVSGYHHRTTKNWTTIISAKKTNGNPPEEAAMIGKIPEMSALEQEEVRTLMLDTRNRLLEPVMNNFRDNSGYGPPRLPFRCK